MGEQLADQQSRLAVPCALERGPDQVIGFGIGIAQVAAEDFLAVIGLEFGLGVERVNVGNATGEEDDDQVLGFGRKVSRLGSQYLAIVDCGGE
jgi:hypothetical protein